MVGEDKQMGDAVADDFFDEDDPFFLVSDRLDAGEDPRSVRAWARGRRSRAKDPVLREQWDEALRYVEEEYPESMD